MTNLGNEIAKQDERRADAPVSVATYISGMASELQRALPRGMNGDRIVRIATTLIRTSDIAKANGVVTTSLSECTSVSFAGAILTAAALGLEPGVNGQAWLIPYRDRKSGRVDCTLQIGYQGLVELAYRHPLVKTIRSGVIRENDPDTDHPMGSLAYISTVAKHRLLGQSGKSIGYWALVELTSGGEILEVLSVANVLALRGKVGPNGGVKDPQEWMERKTALKQALKSAPRSIEAHWAHRVDEESGGSLYVQQIPQQITDEVDHPAIESQPEVEGQLIPPREEE